MDIVTFLRARLADDRAVVDRLENLYPSNRWTRERDEIEAKEKILELHLRTFGERPPTDAIVRALAHPYRHHPDFNPEWSIAR